MRIVIDLQAAQSDSRFRGLGRYSLTLALAMARHVADKALPHELWLLLNSAFPQSVLDIRHAFTGLIPPERIRIFTTPLPVAEIEDASAWRVRAAELLRDDFLTCLQPDLVFVPSLFEGYGDSAVIAVNPLKALVPSAPHIPTVVTLHDLIPMQYESEYLLTSRHKRYYYRKLESLKRADFYLTGSHFTKRESMALLDIPDNHIEAIHHAVDKAFAPQAVSAALAAQIERRYRIARPFVLYTPGGFDPRKNIPRLMQAFAALPVDVRRAHQLVIGSRLVRGGADDTRRQMQAWREHAGLTDDELVLTDYITNDDLHALHNMARLFVFPSYHEGFGLPPLEAMASGTPTIGANTSSVPEVIGNPEALFNPHDVYSMAAKMHQALVDEAFRANLVRRGLAHVQTFSWQASAAQAIDALERFHAMRMAEVKADQDKTTSQAQTALYPSLPPAANDFSHLFAGVATLCAQIKAPEVELQNLAKAIATNVRQTLQPTLWVDVSNLVMHDAKTGIQRVERNILTQLQQSPPQGLTVQAVYFDGVQFRAVGPTLAKDKQDSAIDVCQDDVYLTMDTNHGAMAALAPIYQQWQVLGVQLNFVIHDLLLLLNPQWWPESASINQRQWMQLISQVASRLICISATVADDLRTWLQTTPPVRPDVVQMDYFHIGADFPIPATPLAVAAAPASAKDPDETAKALHLLKSSPSLLSVGTLEPRKGHAQCLDAFELLWAQGEAVIWVIVGKKGWMVDDLVRRIEQHPELGHRLFWLRGISDAQLQQLYTASTGLLNASLGEGFGLPLIEAAQYRLPILCRNLPVFQEVAGSHASYFDAADGAGLAKAIAHWLRAHANGQVPPSDAMPRLTWAQSAAQLKSAMGL